MVRQRFLKQKMIPRIITSFFIVVLLFFTIPLVSAQQNGIYHMKLLAVQEGAGNFTGSEADLFLEIREGSGRVFLETFPLTKLDTQISTRFAKEIACHHFKLDCEEYDFIYTIKAKSSIIGGPSAGAAIAALTTIAMLDLDYDRTATITATINSGGIIGPVGGVKEKLDAASQAGLKKVLVAQGSVLGHGLESVEGSEVPSSNSTSSNDTDTNSGLPSSLPGGVEVPDNYVPKDAESDNSGNYDSNETDEGDVTRYGREQLNLEVVEVVDIDEVLFHFTGKRLNGLSADIVENKDYSAIMQGLQQLLCDRTIRIHEELAEDEVVISQNLSRDIRQKEESALNATKEGDFYSAASFCFGNNIDLKKEYYTQKGLTPAAYARLLQILDRKVASLEQDVDAEVITTISDLQTYMVVKERLQDVKIQIRKFHEQGSKEDFPTLLAYAEERYFSALSWKQFFSMEGREFTLEPQILQQSCLKKISESEERHQYAGLFLGEFYLSNIREKIATARGALEDGEYALCLITASQAKADANAILSSLGLEEKNLGSYLASKKKAVERVLAENIAQDIFPIRIFLLPIC